MTTNNKEEILKEYKKILFSLLFIESKERKRALVNQIKKIYLNNFHPHDSVNMRKIINIYNSFKRRYCKLK